MSRSVLTPRRVMIAAVSIALLAASAGATEFFGAQAPVGDSFAPPAPYEAALRLPGVANDLRFHPVGQFVVQDSGVASLVGMLISDLDPDVRFLLKMTLGGEMVPGDAGYPPVGSPVTNLKAGAYMSGGGPVDTASWRYFTSFSGTLRGQGDMTGANLSFARSGASFQMGPGASGRNVLNGASGAVAVTVLSQPVSAPPLPPAFNGTFTLQLGDPGALCGDEGTPDSYVQWATHHAFIFLGNVGNYEWSSPGVFKERPDGTAVISGIINRIGDPTRCFNVHIDLSSRVDLGAAGYPPVGSPKKELLASAYINNGGPVDTNTWHYYTALSGSLEGTGVYSGASVSISLVGSAFQVGFGANGKNVGYGAASWLLMKVLTQPTNGPALPTTFGGDGNFDLDESCDQCALPADSTPVALYAGVHAFTLYPLGDDFVFDPVGALREFGDGTASVEGFIRRLSHPQNQFFAELSFSGRVDPFDVGYPPAGSPKKELIASAYIENGGTVDTGTWHYYTVTSGKLTGLGSYLGAIVDVARMGPAFQVGFGASGKNLAYGGSGWLQLTTLAQPNQGNHFPGQFGGDGNFDFETDCELAPGIALVGQRYGVACLGSGGVAPRLDVFGLEKAGSQLMVRLDHALGGAPTLLLIGLAGNPLVLPGGCVSNVSTVLAVIGPAVTSGVGPGAGQWMLIANVPVLSGPASADLEALVADPGAMSGVAISNGVHLDLQP